jgi:hypothetical protein
MWNKYSHTKSYVNKEGPMPASVPQTASSTSAPRVSTAPELTLDRLLDLDPQELERLYAGARVPRITDVRGDLRGRMLAVLGLRGRAKRAVRAFAGSDVFPWRGKSFAPKGEDHGEGKNRVVSDRLRLYRFETSVGPSRAGDFDAVQLDYDLPENPFFIRAIKDEIREIAPKLYLGQAYLELRGKAHLVLYFGLAG